MICHELEKKVSQTTEINFSFHIIKTIVLSKTIVSANKQPWQPPAANMGSK